MHHIPNVTVLTYFRTVLSVRSVSCQTLLVCVYSWESFRGTVKSSKVRKCQSYGYACLMAWRLCLSLEASLQRSGDVAVFTPRSKALLSQGLAKGKRKTTAAPPARGSLWREGWPERRWEETQSSEQRDRVRAEPSACARGTAAQREGTWFCAGLSAPELPSGS